MIICQICQNSKGKMRPRKKAVTAQDHPAPAPRWKHFLLHHATFPCSLALLWAIFWLTDLTNVVIWICSLTQTCLPLILIQNEEVWNNLMDLRRTSLILPHFPFSPQGSQTQALSTDAGQRGFSSLFRRQKLKDLSWKWNWYHLCLRFPCRRYITENT